MLHMFHLLELQQEGALVLAPAQLLHPHLDELVEDGGDGLGAHPLQQLQLRPGNNQSDVSVSDCMRTNS